VTGHYVTRGFGETLTIVPQRLHTNQRWALPLCSSSSRYSAVLHRGQIGWSTTRVSGGFIFAMKDYVRMKPRCH
jgi:hypothetical protein